MSAISIPNSKVLSECTDFNIVQQNDRFLLCGANYRKSGKPYLLKILTSTSAEDFNSFRREILNLRNLKLYNCPNIMPIFDYDHNEETGESYFAMPFLKSLKDILSNSANAWDHDTREQETQKLLLEISKALEIAQKNERLPHSRVKPENIYLSNDEKSYVLGNWTQTPIPITSSEGNPQPQEVEYYKADVFSLALVALECAGVPKDEIEKIEQSPSSSANLFKEEATQSKKQVLERLAQQIKGSKILKVVGAMINDDKGEKGMQRRVEEIVEEAAKEEEQLSKVEENRIEEKDSLFTFDKKSPGRTSQNGGTTKRSEKGGKMPQMKNRQEKVKSSAWEEPENDLGGEESREGKRTVPVTKSQMKEINTEVNEQATLLEKIANAANSDVKELFGLVPAKHKTKRTPPNSTRAERLDFNEKNQTSNRSSFVNENSGIISRNTTGEPTKMSSKFTSAAKSTEEKKGSRPFFITNKDRDRKLAKRSSLNSSSIKNTRGSALQESMNKKAADPYSRTIAGIGYDPRYATPFMSPNKTPMIIDDLGMITHHPEASYLGNAAYQQTEEIFMIRANMDEIDDNLKRQIENKKVLERRLNDSIINLQRACHEKEKMQNQHEASLKAHQDAKEKLRENIENANEKLASMSEKEREMTYKIEKLKSQLENEVIARAATEKDVRILASKLTEHERLDKLGSRASNELMNEYELLKNQREKNLFEMEGLKKNIEDLQVRIENARAENRNLMQNTEELNPEDFRRNLRNKNALLKDQMNSISNRYNALLQENESIRTNLSHVKERLPAYKQYNEQKVQEIAKLATQFSSSPRQELDESIGRRKDNLLTPQKRSYDKLPLNLTPAKDQYGKWVLDSIGTDYALAERSELSSTLRKKKMSKPLNWNSELYSTVKESQTLARRAIRDKNMGSAIEFGPSEFNPQHFSRGMTRPEQVEHRGRKVVPLPNGYEDDRDLLSWKTHVRVSERSRSQEEDLSKLKEVENLLMEALIEKNEILEELTRIDRSKVKTMDNMRRKREIEQRLRSIEQEASDYRVELREFEAFRKNNEVLIQAGK